MQRGAVVVVRKQMREAHIDRALRQKRRGV
jgi:hypothetical protein